MGVLGIILLIILAVFLLIYIPTTATNWEFMRESEKDLLCCPKTNGDFSKRILYYPYVKYREWAKRDR